MGSQLLAALQCVRCWLKDGKEVPPVAARILSDDDLEWLYNLAEWGEQPHAFWTPRTAITSINQSITLF